MRRSRRQVVPAWRLRNDERRGWEGNQRAGQRSPAFIVIRTTASGFQLTIPGSMGGMELIRRLLELDRSVTMIVSSGYSNDPIMADYRSLGFKGVLIKPYSVPALTSVLHEALFT